MRHMTERLVLRWTGLQPAMITSPTALPAASAWLPSSPAPSLSDMLQDGIWFAVPKKKVSRSRKRKKNHLRDRLKLKKNIIDDPRTGELTLKHKMPENWKDFLPQIAKDELTERREIVQKRIAEQKAYRQRLHKRKW